MPLASGGFFYGIFILTCIFVVAIPQMALPLVFVFSSMYFIWQDRLKNRWALLFVLLPFALGVHQKFIPGAFLYGYLLLFSVIQSGYIKKSYTGLSVFIPTCVLILIFILTLKVQAYMLSVSLIEVITRGVDSIMNQISFMYEEMLPKEQLLEFKINRPNLENKIVRFFPALLASGIAFIAWVNLLIIANSRRLQLCNWRAPDWVVLVFIIASLGTLLPVASLKIAGANLLVMVCIVYFFQGIAIVGYFFDARGWKYFIRGLIYVLILSQIYIMIIVSGLGLFDTWFEFRERIKPTRGDHI